MSNKDRNEYLRLKAEDILHGGMSFDKTKYEKDLESLIEDLNIYQIELELQNQDLEESERQLTQSKGKYQDLFENAPIGYMVIDRQFRIQELNKTATMLLDHSYEQAKGLAFTRFIDPEYQDIFYLEFRKMVTGTVTGSVVADVRIKKEHIAPLYVRLIGIPDTHSIKDRNFRVAMIDITTEKMLEVNLIAESERARESDRLQTAFVANMSHEIRTPLNSVIGFSSMIVSDKLSKQEIKEYADIVSKSGTRLLNLINNVLDISKIESRSMPLDYSLFSPYVLIEDAISLFKLHHEAEHVEVIQTSVDLDPEYVIQSDLLKCSHIVSNLLSNALKYTVKGQIQIGFKKNDQWGIFYVKDSGIGISKSDMPYVFDRFYRVNNPKSRHIEGTGLGLYLSKKLAELMNCRLTFDSEQGVGSEFRLEIPLNSLSDNLTFGNSDSVDEMEDQDIPRHNLKLLIAEDDKYSAHLLDLHCRKSEISTLLVENGDEAVTAVQHHPELAMVFMDIKMPLLDGYEATRRIRRFNKNIPIVAVTAFALDGDRENAISAGCNDYITKPVSREDIQRVFRRFL